MKKIIFITKHFHTGGVERSLLEIIKSLNSKEYDITIGCICKEGELLEEFLQYCKIYEIQIPPDSKYGIKKCIVKCDLKNAIKGIVCKCIGLFQKNKVKKYKRLCNMTAKLEEEYDYAISFHAPNSLATVYTINNITAQYKYCWIHFDISKAANEDYDSKWKEIYKHYNQFICVSNSVKKAFLNIYSDLEPFTSIIYNLVDKERINKLSNEKVNMDFDRKIVLCTVGRLSADKGYLLVLEVCKKLKNSGYEFVWLIVGEGTYRNIIEEKRKAYGLEENVILFGNQKNPYKYMKRADIYVQPSRTEGHGITLQEARVLKKAIITTDFDSAYEQIENMKNGLIVENNVDSLAEGIIHLADNIEIRIYLSSNTESVDNYSSINKISNLFTRE